MPRSRQPSAKLLSTLESASTPPGAKGKRRVHQINSPSKNDKMKTNSKNSVFQKDAKRKVVASKKATTTQKTLKPISQSTIITENSDSDDSNSSSNSNSSTISNSNSNVKCCLCCSTDDTSIPLNEIILCDGKACTNANNYSKVHLSSPPSSLNQKKELTGAYHQMCHYPPVLKIPQQDWFCRACTVEGTNGKGNVKSKKSNSKKQKITPVAGARSAATISAEAAGERERTNERKWLQPPTSTTKLTHQIRSARLVRSAQRRKCQQC